MGNFSRDTFDEIKHYVSVRLQQGVPIVDADWNEMEDIRRWELRNFIKWFVGDGVPKGNDGFRIEKTEEQPGTPDVEVAIGSFVLPDIESSMDSPSQPDIEVPIVTPSIPVPPPPPLPTVDFIIKEGRCLVDGWEVINEYRILYTQQPLYLAGGLPDISTTEGRTDTVYLDVWEREVDSNDPFDKKFDLPMVNEAIGIETCVRIKREWVVRVAEGLEDPASLEDHLGSGYLADHAYYPLARLFWNEPGKEQLLVEDLRRIGIFSISSRNVQQLTADAFGQNYIMNYDGQPKLKVSLRDAINSLLKGQLPSTVERPLTNDSADVHNPFVRTDSEGDIWVFWYSKRSGNLDIWYKRYRVFDENWQNDTQLTTNPASAIDVNAYALADSTGDLWVFWCSDRGGNRDIWYNRYHRISNSWQGDTQLTIDAKFSGRPNAIVDSAGNIWVFWYSDKSGNSDIWYNRYYRTSDSWQGDTPLTTDSKTNKLPFAVTDSTGDLWVFWRSDRSGNWDIWYNRYLRTRDIWQGDTPLTIDAADDLNPYVIADSTGDIWIFWRSKQDDKWSIWYNRYTRASDSWQGELLTANIGTVDLLITYEPYAVTDSVGDIWIFWQSDRNGSWGIWFNRYHRESNSWQSDTPLTSDIAGFGAPCAIADDAGDIWLFWLSNKNGSKNVWYKKIISTI